MYNGLMLVEQRKALEEKLERAHKELVELVAGPKSEDGLGSTNGRLLTALETQQAAWLKYRDEECELIGALTGSGGSWPSTYANRCESNHTEQRLRRVRSAKRCIERLPTNDRLIEKNNCLQQLAPLTNRL